MIQPTDPSPKPLLRVLIVDDTPEVLHDLRRLLELSGGMEVVGEAGCGTDAVRLAGGLKPDVVVMDLGMPGMDGYEAARQIKMQGFALRVVILSVHNGETARERARLNGADEFVVKGASYETLIHAIRGGNTSFNGFECKKGETS
jgi:DNA-binding NarL/FixJ family response regulator